MLPPPTNINKHGHNDASPIRSIWESRSESMACTYNSMTKIAPTIVADVQHIDCMENPFKVSLRSDKELPLLHLTGRQKKIFYWQAIRAYCVRICA